MIVLQRGQTGQFKFIFVSENQPYDPTASTVPSDIYFTVLRGDYSTGAVVDGPFSFIQQDPYVYQPGTVSKFISTPDNAALDITGDLEIVLKVAADSWKPTQQKGLFGKYNSSTNQRSFLITLETSGKLYFIRSSDGINTSSPNGSSFLTTNAVPFTDGKPYWLKVTYSSNIGGNHLASFFYSQDQNDEPTNWISIPSAAAVAGTGPIFSGSANLLVGGWESNSGLVAGKFYRAILRNGINGTTVADFDARKVNYNSSTYLDNYGRTWTLNGGISLTPTSKTGNATITKTNKSEYTLSYTVPNNFFEGVYSIISQTTDNISNLNITSTFQVKGEPVTVSPTIATGSKTSIINYKPIYQELNQSNTSTILLLGHADGIELNYPVRIRSVQSAIDLLGADLNSPLLRGVFDAYSAGARDIIICAVAPMLEYVESPDSRNVSTTIFNLSAATPSSYTFYSKYHERLAYTYSLLKDLDFVDYVVPLEASIIQTGNIDFVTQLANYLSDFHNTTGNVQLGVIGSRTNGVSSSDIDLMSSLSLFKNKFTKYNLDGTIASDIGRFIIPIYGECVYQHPELKRSYTSSAAAGFAGLMSTTRLNMGITRTRLPGAASVFGNDISQVELNKLEAIGMNTVYRGQKTRRSIPFEVYITNDYTMANSNSTLSKAPQMRLIARIVSEVRGFSYNGIGKFGYDSVVNNVRNYLSSLKDGRVILDFAFNVEVDPYNYGGLIFYIEILSAFGLRQINFAVSTGPGA